MLKTFTVQAVRTVVETVQAESFLQACVMLNEDSNITDSFAKAESNFSQISQENTETEEDDGEYDDFALQWPMEEMVAWDMSIDPIGSIDNESGEDAYYLVWRIDGALTPAMAEAYMLPRVFRECGGPGQPFCNVVRAVQTKYSDSKCIVTVEYRRDI